MNNFKLNESDILSNQDWTFPTNIAYGPGRLKEIGAVSYTHLTLPTNREV